MDSKKRNKNATFTFCLMYCDVIERVHGGGQFYAYRKDEDSVKCTTVLLIHGACELRALSSGMESLFPILAPSVMDLPRIQEFLR
jgi:hypothetical protein